MSAENDIRELWAQAIAAQTSEELDLVIPRLQQALHRHCEDIRAKLAEYPIIARRLVRQINELLPDQDVIRRTTQARAHSNKKT